VVSSFARQLPDNFGLADLRPREVGSGFSWGLAGPNAEVRRDRAELLFVLSRRRTSDSRAALLFDKPDCPGAAQDEMQCETLGIESSEIRLRHKRGAQ